MDYLKYELGAIIGLIAMYPVHIMTFVGCVLLFFPCLTETEKKAQFIVHFGGAAFEKESFNTTRKVFPYCENSGQSYRESKKKFWWKIKSSLLNYNCARIDWAVFRFHCLGYL